jgi:hypothetical protein
MSLARMESRLSSMDSMKWNFFGMRMKKFERRFIMELSLTMEIIMSITTVDQTKEENGDDRWSESSLVWMICPPTGTICRMQSRKAFYKGLRNRCGRLLHRRSPLRSSSKFYSFIYKNEIFFCIAFLFCLFVCLFLLCFVQTVIFFVLLFRR